MRRRYPGSAPSASSGVTISTHPDCERKRALLRVEVLDLVRVLLVDRLALELHRRRELVTARLPVGREDLELLDLLDARQVLVGPVDAFLNGGDHLLVGCELLERVVLDAVLLRE